MLFMSIFTFEPEKRDEVIKRRAEKGAMAAGKLVGEWSAIGGHRVFRLSEMDDPKALLQASLAWTDLGKIEIIPIMEVEEVMKLVSSKK